MDGLLSKMRYWKYFQLHERWMHIPLKHSTHPSKPSTSHPMSPTLQINLPNQTPKGKGKLSIMPQPGPSWKMPNPVTPKNEQCTISNNSSLWGNYSIGEDMLEEISNQLSKLESNSTIHSMSSA